MSILTIVLAACWLVTLALLIRSLFRQAGIQDTLQETSHQATDQLKLWEEFGQHLDESVALIGSDDGIEYANQRFAQLTGWQARSSFHQPLSSVLKLQDESAQSVDVAGRLPSGVLYVINQDGSRTPVHAGRRPLSKPEGYSVVVLHDATSELAEKELRHRLVNLSSFELRAPVTAMKGYASMLLDGDAGKLPKSAVSYVQPILESTDKLLTIIDDMAHVEELSNTKQAAKKVAKPIEKLLADWQPKLEQAAKEAGHDLTITGGRKGPQLAVDAQQIGRLLAMLVSTAARTAKPKTAVTLSIAYQPNTIDFQISNHGDPLPKQSQANVFDYAGGHGLDEGVGFYVAKQIIESHHAFVTVNTAASGNTFVLSLPHTEQPATEATPQPTAPAPTADVKAAVDSLSKNDATPSEQPAAAPDAR